MSEPDPPDEAFEDSDEAWGDRQDSDDDRFERERPPHHDRAPD